MSADRRYKLGLFFLVLFGVSSLLVGAETIQLFLSGQLQGFSLSDYGCFVVVEFAINLFLIFGLGLGFGILAWFILDMVDKSQQIPRLLHRYWIGDFAFGARVNAKIMGLLASCALGAGLIGWLTYFAVETYNNHELIGLFSGGVGLAAIGLSFLIYMLVWRLLAWVMILLALKSRVLRFLLSPLFLIPFVIVAAFAAGMLVVSMHPELFEDYDLRNAAYGSALVIMLLLSLWFSESGHARFLTRRPAFIRRGALLMGLLFVLSVLFSNSILDSNMAIRAHTVNSTAYTKHVLSAVRAISDFDGDGYSSLFGGGDCNDFDAHVNPKAIEIPENGIDENCLAGDYVQASSERKPIPNHTRADGQEPIKNVVFIIVDATRFDLTSFGNSKHDTTPELKAIGESDCTVFQRAYSPGSKTAWSLGPFFFGRRSSMLKWKTTESLVPVVDASEQSIAELLAKDGYVNTAFAIPEYMSKYMRGHFQGFDFRGYDQMASDAYKKNRKIPTSDLYTDKIIAHLKGWKAKTTRRPFFIYAHYFDPHASYKPHKANAKFGRSSRGLYMGELHYTDQHIARLYNWLKQNDLLNETVFIFSGDHGEGLGDHHAGTHGQNLYDEQTHVPLMICAPQTEARVVTQAVSLLDIPVTILDLMAKPIPLDYQGRSLVPLLDGKASDPADIVMEILPDSKNRRRMTAIVSEGWKLIYNHISQSYQLFDLTNDPKEQVDLFSKPGIHTGDLLAKLQLVIEEASANQGARKSEFIVQTPPKDMVPLNVAFEDGIDLLGYVVDKKKIAKGAKQTIALYWSARDRVSRDYQVFIHVHKSRSRKIVFKVDHAPANNSYPTSSWNAGEIIKDEFTFTVPEDWQGNVMNIWMGMWHKKRLPFELTDVRVPRDKRNRLKLITLKLSGGKSLKAKIKPSFPQHNRIAPAN
jgi:arylsulfatase A-like enzyme